MAEIKTGVTLSLKDLFSQGMGKAAGAASGFAGKTLGAIEKVDKAISGTAAKLAAFGLTLSVGAAAKGIIELDHRMTRLGLSVNASAERISKLKRTIFDVAQSKDIKIDPDDILSGIEVVISQTSDLKYAEDNIRNIALAIQATGESGESMGKLFSEFRKFEYSTEQISSLMDDMVAQANQGAFSLADFAKAAPQIFSVLEAKKIGAMPENIKSVNAALQIINAGAKNPTKTVAAFNSVFEEMTDPTKQKYLRKLVNVKDSNGKLKDFNDIMFEIVEKAKDPRNASLLNRIFNSSSMLAINSYISHGEKMKDTLLDLGDTTGLLQKQSAKMADTMESNIKNLRTAFKSFADSNLTKPLEHLTNLLNKLAEDPERIKKVFSGIAWGIGAIATVKGIAQISGLVGRLLQLKSGNINIAGALNMATAMPVYVTNWGGGPGVPGIGTAGQFPQINPLLRGSPSLKVTPAQAGGAALLTAALTAAYEIPEMVQKVNAINQNEELTAKEKGRAKGEAIGGGTGGIVGSGGGIFVGSLLTSLTAGAISGTAIGTAVPGLGNIIGLIVGAGIGAAGYYWGKKVGHDVGGSIGESLASDGSSKTHSWKESSALRWRQLPVSDLPPQITQTGSSVTPQKVEIGGQAVMDVNVNLSGPIPSASVTMRENTTDFRFNTGSRNLQRRNGM